MSMLAERRRKTKWVINPTKKPLWATDSNGIKFGKELMEKMGWSAGKGLGANEQGIQEPLRVSYKNDTKGMGFKGNDDDWIEQQDEFNVLLNQLRNSDDSSVVKVSAEEGNEIKSLEEKSKQSRARVHYQKFTRGKDLSRYSENDLACILGTNKIKKEKSKTEEVVESEEKTEGRSVTSFGVTTINSGSIQDYFKRKWINDKSKSLPDMEKETEGHSCDERPSFTRVFGASLNLESKEFSKKEHKADDGALNGSEMNGDSEEKYEKRKKRKKKDIQTSEEEEPKGKRKKTYDQDNPVGEELQNTLAGVANTEIETENLLGNENDCDSSRKRKKEKRKSRKDEGNDANEEGNMMEVKKKRKKERKEKPVENGHCDAEEVASIDCSVETECPERERELVKKKKGKTGNEIFGECKKENIEGPSLEVCMGEMNDVVEGEDVRTAKEKKKKEKYKKHGESGGVDEPIGKNEELGRVSDVCEGNLVEVGSKKKKKEKEKQDDKTECCSNENGISSEIPEEKCCSGNNFNSTTEIEQVKKKKKKKKEKQEDKMECHSEPSSQEKCDGETNSNNTVELDEVKKKKKKKEDRMECLSNEKGFSSDFPLEKCDSGSNLNSTTEIEQVKKKKKKKKEKQEDKKECHSEPSNHEKCDGETNSNSTADYEEVKKKKKKDKHKTKEEDSDDKYMKESRLEEAYQEAINGPLESETVEKKKKKKEKKEKQKSIDEASADHQEHQEIKESRPDHESMNEGVGSDAKKTKKKKSTESEERKDEGEEREVKANIDMPGSKGNAEIGTTAGIDRVELISQRVAYEHVAGQHRYERVKNMFQCINLERFRGSNLEWLDGYGNSLRKCRTSDR